MSPQHNAQNTVIEIVLNWIKSLLENLSRVCMSQHKVLSFLVLWWILRCATRIDPPLRTEDFLSRLLGDHPQLSAPSEVSSAAESFLTQGHTHFKAAGLQWRRGIKAWHSRPTWGQLCWVIHLQNAPLVCSGVSLQRWQHHSSTPPSAGSYLLPFHVCLAQVHSPTNVLGTNLPFSPLSKRTPSAEHRSTVWLSFCHWPLTTLTRTWV